jgi:hypothetical protein
MLLPFCPVTLKMTSSLSTLLNCLKSQVFLVSPVWVTRKRAADLTAGFHVPFAKGRV